MKARKLTLKKDTLHELGTDELAAVAGGSGKLCNVQTLYSCDTLLTGMYPTLPLLTCIDPR